jgi:heme exporter protein A
VTIARAQPADPADRANLAVGTALEFDHISADDISRTFGRRRALSHVTFEARRGRILGLLGPNGAGKSTMLAVLATLLNPTSGALRFGGTSSAELQSRGDGGRLRARIGVLGHDLFLYPELTARENLVFFAGVHGVVDPARAAADALRFARLDDRADDPVSSFSRGMRQRVALERALLHGPRLILLDEPFTGLDQASAAALVARLRGRQQAGCMIVLATHDLDIADGLITKALFLIGGKPVGDAAGSGPLRQRYQAAVASVPA